MSSNKAKRHTHKYHKIDMLGSKIWACALPDCNHYMPKHMENLIPGKSTYCWECNSSMVLDPKALTMDRPICIDCRNPGMNKLLSEKELEEIRKVIGKKDKGETVESDSSNTDTDNDDLSNRTKDFVDKILNGIK